MFGSKNRGGPDGEAAVKNEKENTGADKAQMEESRALQETLGKINNKLVVLSGKGGVGKSTVAVNLAVSLSKRGYRVGLLDVDVHGPSVPKMLGIDEEKPYGDKDGKLIPVEYNGSLKVISIGFMMDNKSDAVIWRGPLKYNVIKQFIKDVLWGDLDYLVIDCPPGTGDEPLSVVQLITEPKGAVVVTTPQDVAVLDVMKSITFCEKLEIPVIGVVENMSGLVCPHCGEKIDVFKTGGGEKMAEEMNVPFLGSVPLETDIVQKGDAGKPFTEDGPGSESAAAKAFDVIIEKIIQQGVN